jgi:hypothetical protein
MAPSKQLNPDAQTQSDGAAHRIFGPCIIDIKLRIAVTGSVQMNSHAHWLERENLRMRIFRLGELYVTTGIH